MRGWNEKWGYKTIEWVLIVPKWNGNEKEARRVVDSAWVLIVPKWNGNFPANCILQIWYHVLIVPKWNGNNFSGSGGGDGGDVLIVPKWNGNYSKPPSS